MSNLGDDEFSLIFHWIKDSNNRNSFSLVCKRWLRVRVKPICLFGSLNPILSKVFYQNSQFYAHLNQRGFSAMPISNLWPKHDLKRRFFMLISKKKHQDSDYVGDDGICAIANGCSKFSKVSLRRRRKSIGNVGTFISIVNKSAQGLTNLDLGRYSLISDQALEVTGTVRTNWVLKLDCYSLITKVILNRCLRFALRQTWPSLVH